LMARIFIDGFEHGDLSLWDIVYSATINSSSLITGTYAANLANGTYYLQKFLPAAAAYYVAFKIRPQANATADGTILKFYNGATVLGSLVRKQTTNYLAAYKGDASSVLATGSTAVNSGTTYTIEVYYLPNSSSGVFTVKINGVQTLTFSGNSGTTANIDSILFTPTGASHIYYLDDVVVDDAEWPGTTYIQKIVPTGAGTTTAWTPSTGNNWAAVDEVVAVDTDYVSTNVADNVDTYAAGDLTGTIGTVKCVQLQARARAEGVPTPTTLQLVLRSGGADRVSSSKAVQTAFAPVTNLWQTDPADSAAWTDTKVNALEIGIKATA
jgi:hypothetical protein